MNTLALLAVGSLGSTGGIVIPQPVWIILTCLVCIFLILLIARAFGLVMN